MDPCRLLALVLLVRIVFHAGAEDSEVKALLNFKISVDDPLAALNDWKAGTNVCHWIGVSCSSVGRITGIQIDSLSLSGTIQGNLSASGNNFTEIHISPQKCSLEVLDLSSNNFTSDFLDILLVTCKGIRISGSIPASIFASCKSLRFLEISSNQLVGGVPEDMFINCRSLQELSLSSNNLTGELSGLRSSNSLQKLNLSTNVFTSFQIEHCPSLEELDLSFNNISGTDKFQAGSGYPSAKLHEEVFILQGIRLDDFEHKDGSSCYWQDRSTALLRSQAQDHTPIVVRSSRETTRHEWRGQLKHIQLVKDRARLKRTILVVLRSYPSISIRLDRRLVFHGDAEDSELEALLSFKNSVDDPLVALNNWKAGTDVCQWIGVSCSSVGRITGIQLDSLSLSGLLPFSTIQALPQLRTLSASGNNFTGIKISPQKCSLEVLNLSSNDFTSDFLDILLVTCKDIRISGSIPASIFTLCKSLSDNHVFGPFLSADHNNFIGELPTVPPSLNVLDLSCNLFSTGNPNICPARSSLKSLLLVYNRLHGRVLNSAMNCGNLEMLDISINSLAGPIPVDMCSRLPKLQHLLLWGNNLEGSIPATISNCSELVTLNLSFNNLTGVIPQQISGLKKLWLLLLSNNMISGAIPASIGSMLSLRSLVLGHNMLQGGLPSELRNNKGLFMFLVNDNQLTGQIPGWIGRSSEVDREKITEVTFPFLMVFAINIEASICKAYEEVFILQGIRLDDFEQLPFATRCRRWFFLAPPGFNLTIYTLVNSPLAIDLSHNSFTGTIPEEFGGMRDLNVLNLAHNLLTGAIPSTIGNLKNLEWLDLSQNWLESNIPDSLGNLTFLNYLNISNNKLFGRVPQSAQLALFPVSSYEGNPGLCGFPLAECASLHDPFHDDHKDENDDDGHGDQTILAAIVGGGVSCILWTFAVFFSKRWEALLKRLI
ncbi:receptor-like protein kinase BRI1-like 3 [Selaginella moellendorffii]|uniref:receptor-like protein kinase BRI1-like 3 n=1 Tax=Selaginella moellendorffii TaxID=88036 RepID=UPI000D1C43AF|nr:receptor-like protein kinase BRI1-like 3 [Selaginella moellendorffii]|eukprot:XP_024529717.1 receptor-like protein kinase BRI1-like 3 [Selaginella moellendorffii]